MGRIVEIRQAASDLFSQKPTSSVTHGAVGREIKNVGKIAGAAGRAIGRKVKRFGQVRKARKAFLQKGATQAGIRKPIQAHIEQHSDVLIEILQKFTPRGRQIARANKAYIRKGTAQMLARHDRQRAHIKKEKKLHRRVMRHGHERDYS